MSDVADKASMGRDGVLHPETLEAGGASPPQPQRTLATWWSLLGLIALVAAAYGQTLRFDLVLDDHFLVIRNPVFRGGVTWWNIVATPASAYLGPMFGADRMYRPAMATVAALDRAVWGLRPGGFHLSSVLAHLAVVLLLWQLAWALTGSRAAAFAAAALLAVHPSAVEAVAFIAARMDLFVGIGMAAVLLLLRGCARPRGAWRLGAALLASAGALASKETALAIPVLVTWTGCVYPQWFGAPGATPPRRALALRVLLFWALLLPYGVVRKAALGSVAPMPVRLRDLPGQSLRALAAISTYGEMTVIPQPETGFLVVGRLAPPTGPGDPSVLLGGLIVAVLAGSLLWLRRRHPPSALALGWYVAALLPTVNLVPIHWEQAVYVAERSLYSALAGWCLFVAVGGFATLAGVRSRPFRSPVLARSLGGAVVGTLLFVTFTKVGAWRDDVTLWTAALASHPGSLEARLNLAAALAEAGRLEEAEAISQEAGAALPANPDVPFVAGWIAELRGRDAEAMRQYERAIALGSRRWRAFRQAAVLAAKHKDWNRAGHWFAAAADLFPRAAWPQVGLAWSRQREGRADRARVHFDRAKQLEPSSPELAWLLGVLLAAEGRVEEAGDAYRAALAIDPSFVLAHRGLAASAEQKGRIAEAIEHWRRIAQTLPERQREEALAHLRRLESARGSGISGEAR